MVVDAGRGVDGRLYFTQIRQECTFIALRVIANVLII